MRVMTVVRLFDFTDGLRWDTQPYPKHWYVTSDWLSTSIYGLSLVIL